MPVTQNAAPGPRRHAYPMRSLRGRVVRLGLLAATLGLAALIVVPGLELATRPASLDGRQAAAAAAEEPSASATPAPVQTGGPSATPSTPSAPPVRSLGAIGSTARAEVVNAGVPPSRLAAEPGEPTAPNPAVLTGYIWPLAHPRLTLPFGPTPWGEWLVDGQTFHDGVDIATFCGDHVRAAHSGVVLAAGRHFDGLIGWVGDLGPYYRRLDRRHAWGILPNVVVIDDGNGYRSMYAHFSQVVVRVGQRVKAGQLLGYEGATGHASGCHVHYGLYSPLETATFRLNPATVRRMLVPSLEIARINPRIVLGPLPKWVKPSSPPPSGG